MACEFKTPLPLPAGVLPTFNLQSVNSSKSNEKQQSSKYSIYSSSRSYTGPSSVTSATARLDRSFVIAAVVEGRGHAQGEVGLASMDIRHPELSLAQFSDSASYDKLRIKLQILNPVEIIVPETALELGGNMFQSCSMLKSNFPMAQIVPTPRKNFNDAKALELIRTLKTPDCNTIEKDITDKYYCLSCAAALLSYIEHIQNIMFSSNSVRIVYKGLEKTCMIDPSTAKNLELLVSLKNANDTEGSLFGVINKTFTAGGQRMLKAIILQPSTDVPLIEQRLNAVEELLNDEQVFNNIRNTVSRMLDVDRLVALCSHVPKNETVKWAEYKLAQLINLKHTLELVDQFRDRLEPLKSESFHTYSEMLRDARFADILQQIYRVINEDTRVEKSSLDMKLQKCFAVRSNLNGLLDLARRTYCELVNDVQESCAHIVEETGIPFKIAFTSDRGFYLRIYAQNTAFLRNPPDILVNVSEKSSLVTCTTRALIKLNDRINEVKAEIIMMSNTIVSDLLATIKDSIVCLFNLTEVVSSCDMLACLAYNCTTAKLPMCRPTFADTLAVKSTWHPLLEKYSFSHITTNDVYIGPEANFVIITGPNMAGKSTYLKMVAVVQIMAQIGSFVPASEASVRVANQIFTRTGESDDLENNLSAFQVEMIDVNYILQNFDNDSLIVIDELARSTSAEEGYALSHAICEEFIASKAFVILSTHFLDLARLDSLYPNVENFHFPPQLSECRSSDQTHQIALNHAIKRGSYRGPMFRGCIVVEIP